MDDGEQRAIFGDGDARTCQMIWYAAEFAPPRPVLLTVQIGVVAGLQIGGAVYLIGMNQPVGAGHMYASFRVAILNVRPITT